jgi:hypothetical protein
MPPRQENRKLNDDERRAIVRKVDEILGLASPSIETSTSADSNAGPPSEANLTE